MDSIGEPYQKKTGFKTDGNTRPMIISKEMVLIRDNIELFTDIEMLRECLTFVYDKNMRPDSQVGKHDDLLFSDMIANQIRTQQTYYLQKEIKEIKGFYTETELEDMVTAGRISKYQMKQYLKGGVKSW